MSGSFNVYFLEEFKVKNNFFNYSVTYRLVITKLLAIIGLRYAEMPIELFPLDMCSNFYLTDKDGD